MRTRPPFEATQSEQAETGADPYEMTLEVCERYGNLAQVVLFYRTEQDVQTFLGHPLALTTADLGRLDYRHRRRPMFPYEPRASYPER